MKRILYLTAIMLVVMLCSLSSAHAEVTQDRTVESDKVWTITFNTPVDIWSAKSAIGVINSEQKPVSLNITYGKNNKQVIVEPEQGTYEPGHYTLNVSESLSSMEGVAAEEAVEMTFQVESEGWKSWQSVQQLNVTGDDGGAYTVHLLADQKAPDVMDSSYWYDNEFSGEFKFGLEKDGVRTISPEPVTNRDYIQFYQNNRVDLDRMVRKLDDRVFVISQMDSATFTGDYYYALKDGEIQPVAFTNGQDRYYAIENTFSELEHKEGDLYEQSYYHNGYGKHLKTTFRFDFSNMTMTPQVELTLSQIQQKSDYLQDKVHNIMYNDLVEEAYYGTNRDYSRIESTLDSYITDRFNEEVEEAYYEACVECDSLYYNLDFAWDLHMRVIENHEDRVIVETVQPESFGYLGSYETLTLKKEGEHWKLHEMDWEVFDAYRHLDLSVEEAEQRIRDEWGAEDITFLRSYDEYVKDHDGNYYWTKKHEFSIDGGSRIVTVDASTGGVPY